MGIEAKYEQITQDEQPEGLQGQAEQLVSSGVNWLSSRFNEVDRAMTEILDDPVDSADRVGELAQIIEESGDAQLLYATSERLSGMDLSYGDQLLLNGLAHKLAPNRSNTSSLEDARSLFRSINRMPGAQDANHERLADETDFSGRAPVYLTGMNSDIQAQIYELHFSGRPADWLRTLPNSNLVPSEAVDRFAQSHIDEIRLTGNLHRCQTDPLSFYGIFNNPNLSKGKLNTFVAAVFREVATDNNNPRHREIADRVARIVNVNGGPKTREVLSEVEARFYSEDEDQSEESTPSNS